MSYSGQQNIRAGVEEQVTSLYKYTSHSFRYINLNYLPRDFRRLLFRTIT